MTKESELVSTPPSVEELWICRIKVTQLSSWELNDYQLLKKLVLGNSCLIGLSHLRLSGLNELEYVSVQSDCCFGGKGSFQVARCPKLRSLQIGNYSFSDYHVLELEELPSLESIAIGEQCFYEAPLFSLTGLSN